MTPDFGALMEASSLIPPCCTLSKKNLLVALSIKKKRRVCCWLIIITFHYSIDPLIFPLWKKRELGRRKKLNHFSLSAMLAFPAWVGV